MAALGWRTRTPVAERLAREPERFEAEQALRLMEAMTPARLPVGEGSHAGQEAVRLTARVAHGFPASDVTAVKLPLDARDQGEVEVSFLGLAGAFGPLPGPVTDLVIQRARKRDRGFKDFLDIFNHRLISLLLRARRLHHPALSARSPEKTPYAEALYALIGLGTRGLQGRMALKDRSLLLYAGLLARRPVSLAALKAVIETHFALPASCKPLTGVWLRLDPDQWTRLGADRRGLRLRAPAATGEAGANNRLGESAVLGRRIWSQDGGIELMLGPLDYRRFSDLLPGQRGHAALKDLLRFALGDEVEVRLRLVLDRAEVPQAALRGAPSAELGEGARLGWSAWLGAVDRSGGKADEQVSLRLAGNG